MRRLLLVVWLGLLTIGVGLLLGLLAGPGWAAFALLPPVLMAWGWVMLGRNWRSWRYAERADDLLISRGCCSARRPWCRTGACSSSR